jgi:5'-nucleotidase
MSKMWTQKLRFMQFILEEDRDSGYHARTEINAREADVTIAIAVNFDSLGEKLTKEMAKKHKRLYIPVSPYGDISDKAHKIVAKLNETFRGQKHSIVINIAGNGLNTMKGVLTQQQCDDFTYNLLFSMVNNPALEIKIKGIRSGGQTGFDEAGLKAGIRLKIDTTAYFPKGYRIRDLQGDKNQTREEVFKRLGIKQRVKVFVDMDGVLCDFKGSYLQWKKDHPEIEYPQSQFGFFSNLTPIPGSIEGFKKLQKHFDVYILTRPSIYNLMCYTEKADWVKRHLGFHVLENLITMCDKSLVKGEGAFLIDDTVQAGQLDFEGQFIHFGSEQFKNWEAVLNFLIKDERTLN